MRIGIDVDGCLANWNKGFQRRLVSVTGRDLFSPDYVPTTWHWPYSVGYTRAEVTATLANTYADRFFWRELESYPDVVQAFAYLSHLPLSDDLYFITSRPGIEAKLQTEYWLGQRWSLYGPARITVLVSHHKGLCAQALGLDAYIDDRWENALDVAMTKTQSFLLEQPWNAQERTAAATHGITVVPSVVAFLEHTHASQPLHRIGA